MRARKFALRDAVESMYTIDNPIVCLLCNLFIITICNLFRNKCNKCMLTVLMFVIKVSFSAYNYKHHPNPDR